MRRTLDGFPAGHIGYQVAQRHKRQDAHFLMTSWHANESPEDVTFYLVSTTNFEEHDFKELLILQFGEDSMIESQLKTARLRTSRLYRFRVR